ncbi:MAG: undecaprenyl-phosphate glucose phosphotransferase [Lachnospiraceae bacterium]|nr:undecaprenyl-phosphate glucose phosphotransferase [Lachnospiraceae bacterium]
MIKNNQKFFNQFHVLIDGCIVALAYVLAYYIRFSSGLFYSDPAGRLPMSTYMFNLFVIIPLYLVLFYYNELYTPKRGTGRLGEIWRIFRANVIGLLVLLSMFYLLNNQFIHISRLMLAIYSVLNVVLMSLERTLIRNFLSRMRRSGHNLKHILLVGYSRAAEQYIDRVMANPEWGYKIHAILDDEVPRGASYRDVKVVGSIDNLEYILPENKMDEIVITLPLSRYEDLQKIVSYCEKSGVHTKFVPDYSSVISSHPYMEDLQGLPVVNIRNVPLSDPMNRMVKRFIDIAGSLFGIVITSPIMLVAALAVALTSKGPVIFRQTRIGYHNKPFEMYKFRSMVVQTDEEEACKWTTKEDPRVTKVGRFMRKTSIDELPQLFNILKGDMSMVGPRPERPQFVEKFKEEIPRYMVKHQVRPGLTGWAQINGFRGDTSIFKRVEYDIYYIENWTLGFDIKIIFLTFFKGFINKNAY